MSSVTATQRKLKYVATINDETLGEDTDPDLEIQYVDISNVDSSGSIVETIAYRFEDAPSRARRRIRDGDVIISTVRTYLQAITQVQSPPENMIVSTGFAVVRPQPEFCANYFKYALREPGFLAEVEKRSVGVSYPAINTSDLADIRVHVGPQQRAIADYLDRETVRLDALVAEKKRLLNLLAEKRQALITRAVTRGLDPNVPLRDSGIPWLGEIPAHWDTQKFTRAVSIIEGQVDPESAPYLHWPLIAPNHVESETGRLLYRETAADQGAISGKYKCRANDVIYSKIRPALRKATLADRDSLCSADMYPLRTDESLQPRYLLYLVLSEPFSMWATLESTRVAMPKINREALGNIKIPVPPYREQHAIVRFIENSACRIDELRTVTTATIRLLRERRSAIIEEAVSGGIDVERVK